MNKKIGENIRKLRMEHHIKQNELAVSLDITPTHLSQIESGKKYPSVQLIIDIAIFFKVDPAVIITTDENYYKIQKILKNGGLNELINILQKLNSDLNHLQITPDNSSFL
uniref:helix-turn-helix domain-containing protein n=1 Tax=Candidatus Electronema sp. TaxID=2698783 RepID=UPI0040576033